MKKKILLAITTMFILTLGIVAFAVNQSNNSAKTATDSCAMKMNAQTADGQTKTSCCDRDDCCCKNGSCPMKMSGENASVNCCCSGDSCPIKNKDAQATTAEKKTDAVAGDKSCCKGKHS